MSSQRFGQYTDVWQYKKTESKRFIFYSSYLHYTKTYMYDRSAWNKARFSEKVTLIHKWFSMHSLFEPDNYNTYDTLIS